MMTKYILNSGGIKREPRLKKLYHQEIVQGLGNAPKFLLCNFAQGREYWDTKFLGYCEAIREDMPEGVTASFELAVPATFAEQCKRADVIYVHGGDDHLLRYWMSRFDVPELFTGKVVAGNSAGSDLLVKHHWSNDWRECGDGLGILPIKFIPHFESATDPADQRGPADWQAGYAELAAYGDTSLPIYALHEGEFAVFIDDTEQKLVLRKAVQ